MNGNDALMDSTVSVNEALEDGIPIGQDNEMPSAQDSPNEEMEMGWDAAGDSPSNNPGLPLSQNDAMESQIPCTDGDALVSSNALAMDNDNGDKPAVTPPVETGQDTSYSLDDIYQVLTEHREAQQEIMETLEYGNSLLKISNSIGISTIFAIALVLGALIGRVVWRKL